MSDTTEQLLDEVKELKEIIKTTEESNKNDEIERGVLLKELEKHHGIKNLDEAVKSLEELESEIGNVETDIRKELDDIYAKMEQKGLING